MITDFRAQEPLGWALNPCFTGADAQSSNVEKCGIGPGAAELPQKPQTFLNASLLDLA